MMHRYLQVLLAVLFCAGAHAQKRTSIDMELGAFLRTRDRHHGRPLPAGPAEKVGLHRASARGTGEDEHAQLVRCVRMPAGRITELDQGAAGAQYRVQAQHGPR